MTTQL